MISNHIDLLLGAIGEERRPDLNEGPVFYHGGGPEYRTEARNSPLSVTTAPFPLGWSKNAKKFRRNPVIEIEHLQRDGRRTCRYRISQDFLDAVDGGLIPEDHPDAGEKARTPNRAPTPQDEMKHGAPIPVPIPANLR